MELVAYALSLLAGIWNACRFYKFSQISVFAFCEALLLFCAFDGLLESSSLAGSIHIFLCMVVLIRLAFVSQGKAYFKPKVAGRFIWPPGASEG